MKNNNDKFIEKICGVLDRSFDDLDTATEEKLKRLKYHALDSARQNKSRRLVWGAVPVVAVLLLIVLFGIPKKQPEQIAVHDSFDLNILNATETLDFFAEEIEFYEWLSEIMEKEQDLSGRHNALPVGVPNSAGCSRNRWNDVAQSGDGRVPGVFCG